MRAFAKSRAPAAREAQPARAYVRTPAVRHILRAPQVQTKLKIGAVDDPAEREADRVADQVMRMPAHELALAGAAAPPPSRRASTLQRQCACGGSAGESGQCAACASEQDGMLRRRATTHAEPGHAPPDVHAVLRSPGRPLDAATRAFMEPRFGHDFSNVRVHDGTDAAASARAVNARAYTVGSDVVFGQGTGRSTNDRRLLAHELAHVIQQGGAGAGAQHNLDEPESGRVVQRQSDVRQLPPALPCVTVTGPGHPGGGVSVGFTSGTTISAAGTASITAFHRSWVAGGSSADVSIDGFATTLGAEGPNWTLSCDRAEAVKVGLLALGIPPRKITTFAHGESTEFASSAANMVAVIHSGSRLAASDRTIDRVEQAGSPDSIFFDRNASAIPSPQTGKIDPLARPPDRLLTLFGFVSEDESGGVALATARINAVATALAGNATPHTAPKTPDTTQALTAGVGQIDYRSMRKVIVRPTGAPSGQRNCAAGSTIPCDPPAMFTDAQARADTLLASAISALSPLTAANQPLFDTHFHTTTPANRAPAVTAVLANLTNLRPHISTQMTPVSAAGTPPGPGHRCANDCDGDCSTGVTAYNDHTDAAALVTLCDTPRGFMQQTDRDERAAMLIHEGLHGITLQTGPATTVGGATDFSYVRQRLMRFLDSATAIRNNDSYVAFIRQLAGHAITIGHVLADPASGVAMSFAERLQVDRAIAWLEGRVVWASGEMSSLYDTIDESITAGSWTYPYYRSTMGFVAPRFALTLPPAVPSLAAKIAVAAIAERFRRMRRALFNVASITINRVAAGPTAWSAGPGFDVTIGPDFFSIPANSRHDRAQLDLLLRALVTATTGISADAVTRYVDLVDQIRMHQGGGTP